MAIFLLPIAIWAGIFFGAGMKFQQNQDGAICREVRAEAGDELDFAKRPAAPFQSTP